MCVVAIQFVSSKRTSRGSGSSAAAPVAVATAASSSKDAQAARATTAIIGNQRSEEWRPP
eukprot:6572513-Lingulodinium_polyedra.AAC.1